MKRVVIITALAMLALVGCNKPTGPQTTEIEAVDRPAAELMPAAAATETTTAAETTSQTPAETPASTTTSPPAPTETEKPFKTYTVRKGDTLWAIAVKTCGYGRRYKDIAQSNNITDPNKIYVGQVLQIPH